MPERKISEFVVLIDKKTARENIEEIIRVKDVQKVEIDGSKCKTTIELFKEFSKKFLFPVYFGWNWHAFDECINDLDWINANGFCVIINNANLILSIRSLDFEYFIELMMCSQYEWNTGRRYDSFPTPPKHFYLYLFVDDEETVVDLQNLINTIRTNGKHMNRLKNEHKPF